MMFPNTLFIIPVALFSHRWVLPHPLEISQGQRNTPELVVAVQGQLKVFSDPASKKRRANPLAGFDASTPTH
jgi:hypothetical protein